MTSAMNSLRQAIGALALASATTVVAQQPPPGPPPVTLTVHPLRDGAYWVEGGRSNTGFIVGKTGVIVFDAQMTSDGVGKELAAIAAITPRPVNQIIVSHADPDHVAGLSFYPAGTPIVAHENARSEIVASAADPKGIPFNGAAYKKLVDLPYRTIGESEATTIDGVPLRLIYVAPAHTSGDLMVFLPAARVVYGGDVVLTNTGRFPVIHFGGSSLGWIATMKAILALDADTYVPGHGPIVPKAKLAAMLHDVEERRAAIKAMVDAGKSRAEIEAALPEPGANPMFLDFTQMVYKELTEGYPPASPPWSNLIQKPS